MSTKEGWRAFFDGHAPFYMQEVFTRNTVAEVEFIVERLRLAPGDRVLDLGCGTGRHSVELAARGYRMTGVDLSGGMLLEARKAARARGVQVNWIHADATRFAAPAAFDVALCLCEGAFGLIDLSEDPEAHDEAIAVNLFRSLKPGGRLLLTATNGLRYQRRFERGGYADGDFDPTTLTERFVMECMGAEGPRRVEVREHGHTPEDLSLLLSNSGFVVDHVGGGTAGAWGWRPLDPEEIEIMLIGHRPSEDGR